MSAPAGGIFVCYRREDSAGHAGRIVDALVRHFGKRRVFLDVQAVQAGTDFVDAIEGALDSCFAFVAVIGPRWLELRSTDGERRLDDQDDFIRRELSFALQHGVRVIPVLVQGATMPTADKLPEDLRLVARIQALKLSDERWEYDSQRLIEAVAGRRSSRGWVLKIAVPVAVVAIAGAIAYWQLGDRFRGPPEPSAAPIEAVEPSMPVSDAAAEDTTAEGASEEGAAPAALPPAGEKAPPTETGEPPTPDQDPASEVAAAAAQPPEKEPAPASAPPPPPVLAPVLEEASAQQEPAGADAVLRPEVVAREPPTATQSPKVEPQPQQLPDPRAGWCLPDNRPATERQCAPGYYARLGAARGWMLTPDSLTVIEPVPEELPAEDLLGWCLVRKVEPGEPLAETDVGGCRPGSYARRGAGRGWMLLPKSVISMEPLPRDLPLEDLVGWCLAREIAPGELLVPGIVGGCSEELYAGRQIPAGERVALEDLIEGGALGLDTPIEKLAGRCVGRRVDVGQPLGLEDLRPCR